MKTSLPLLEGKFFCVLPWLHTALFPDGSAKLCCVSGSCVTAGGDPLSLQRDSIEAIWNSDYMRGVRRQMLAGRAVPECSTCYVAEKGGAFSYRQQQNARWLEELGPETLNEIIETSRLQDDTAPEPIFYQLMPGNLCNLKCRMCTPVFSSPIERDEVHSKWVPPLLEHLGRAGIDWSSGSLALGPRQPLGVRYEGFHSLEDNDGKPTRWTSAKASVVVPIPADVRADGVRVKLRRTRRGRRVRILINGAAVYEGKVSWWGLDRTFLVPDTNAELKITLESSTRKSGNDPRELGVMLESLELAHGKRLASAAEKPRLPNGPWYRDDAWVRDVLLANADQLRALYFTGGEPMLEKQVELILDQLIARGAHNRMSLELNTNCTALRESVFNKMLKFHRLTLCLSIDAHGDTYEYIRYPARWETVRKNVDRLAALAGEQISLTANVVLQVYNALDVVRVLEFFDERNIPFDIQIASHPWFVSIGVLPPSVRALAASRLREYADGRCRPRHREMVLSVAHRLERAKNESTPEALRTLMLFSNDLDVTRKQSARAVHGELLDLLEAEGFHWTDELSLAKAA